MNRLKTVGLAGIAMLVTVAVLGVASASASQFRGEAYPVTFNGEQSGWGNLAFTLAGSGTGVMVECEKHHLSGGESTASSALTLTPSFDGPEGCETGYGSTKVTPNGCKYVLHSTNESAPYTGSMDVACNKEGETIEVKFNKCLITIPAQTGLGSVGLSNSGKATSRAIVASFNVSGIKFTGSEGCPAKLVGSFENGTLKGTNTLKGSNAAGTYPLGVYLANEQVKGPRQFNAEKYPATIKGAPAYAAISVRFANFACTATELAGNVETATAWLPATPVFGGCTLSGGGFNIEYNGCQFALTQAEGAASGSAGMSLVCPAGKQLTFTPYNWLGCHIRIGSQEWPTGVAFENTGSGSTRAVSWKATLKSMVYQQEGCPGSANGTFSDGQIEATWTLKGYEGSSQLGLWIE